MPVTMRGRRVGPLGFEITHDPSGTLLRTAPPVDNGGDGSSFSPTDLCAASLGACASTIMSLFAQRNGIALEGIEFVVAKDMSSAPRRIGRLTVEYRLKTDCNDADLARLEQAGRTCPVRLTLGPEVEVVERYVRA
jgi:uncharacterized OsmC-like protein